MFKRIRDFIYDINDIFIALVIIIVAAGIIVWRSTVIMSYPEYLANKEAAAADTVTPIDAPLPSSNTTQNVTINVSPNTGSQNETPNTDSQNTAENTNQQSNTASNTADNTAADQSGQTDPQGGEQTKPVVKANITIEFGFRGNWYTVADRIIEAGVISQEERDAFYNTVLDLGLGRNLQIGTFELSSDMTYEQMIKILCNVN